MRVVKQYNTIKETMEILNKSESTIIEYMHKYIETNHRCWLDRYILNNKVYISGLSIYKLNNRVPLDYKQAPFLVWYSNQPILSKKVSKKIIDSVIIDIQSKKGKYLQHIKKQLLKLEPSEHIIRLKIIGYLLASIESSQIIKINKNDNKNIKLQTLNDILDFVCRETISNYTLNRKQKFIINSQWKNIIRNIHTWKKIESCIAELLEVLISVSDYKQINANYHNRNNNKNSKIFYINTRHYAILLLRQIFFKYYTDNGGLYIEETEDCFKSKSIKF